MIENLKGYVISPFVEGDQLDIHPLVVFVAVLVGATLAGPAGAFVAVPAAAIVDIVVREVVVPWRKEQIADAAAAPRFRSPARGPVRPFARSASAYAASGSSASHAVSVAAAGAVRRARRLLATSAPIVSAAPSSSTAFGR